MMIPTWLKSYLKDKDLIEIEKAVAEAEATTTGEIVPMIVCRSSAIRSVPSYIFIFLFMLFNILMDVIYQNQILGSLNLIIWLYVLGVFSIVPISYVLGRWGVLQRVLIHPLDRDQQSLLRAKNEFYELGLNKTDGSTAILLFVSVIDHEVIILSDKGINDKINPESWEQIKDQMISDLKNKNMGQGFIKAVQTCGEILKPHFPVLVSDNNELPNRLIIKE